MKKIAGLLALVVLLLLWWQSGTEPVAENVVPEKVKLTEPVQEAKVLPWLSKEGKGNVGKEVVAAPELINIGEPLDPDTYLGQGATELINIGEYIDPEADPNLYAAPSELVNIGEYIDPEGDPNLGREPSEYINIGEDIDADEYFYGSAKGAETLINIGEPLDPETVINN